MRSRPRPRAGLTRSRGGREAVARPARPSRAGRRRAPELRELRAQRDRLVEKFTIMEADLGGAFYEMATRDHVRLDVLTRKAAELQRVDAELATVEATLELERSEAAGHLHQLRRAVRAGTRFCGQCGDRRSPAPGAA